MAEKAALDAIARQTGHPTHVTQELNRDFSFISLLGLAFAILNTWTAAAASFSLVLPSGGPTAACWGMWVSGIGTMCMAASLAEMCSVFPTVGGQYHFAALFATPKTAPISAWFTGWASVAGWWALVGTNGSLAGTLITGLVALWHPDYTVNRWLIYVVYAAWIGIAFLINAFAVKALPLINSFALFWSILGAIIIVITILATSRNHFGNAEFVFATTVNETGWPTGIAWILGLLQSAFALTAFDSVMHLCEETYQPEWYAPLGMVVAIAIGTISGFVFILVTLFCVTDYADLLVNPAGALLTIYYQATSNRVGASCLLVLNIGCQLWAATGAVTTASRMTWAFARDGGLPGSRALSKVVRGLDVPMLALIVASFIPIAYGAIFIGSTSAFNAILSSSVIFLNISYIIPIGILIVRGRKILQPEGFPKRRFSLGFLGWPINIFGFVFGLFCAIFFCFPPYLPVTALNMNFSSAVIALIFIIALVMWFISGRRHYTGPRDIDGLLALARGGLQKGQTVEEVFTQVSSRQY